LKRRIRIVPILIAATAWGCGTNLNEVLYQAGNAAGRTAFDIWYTGLLNRLLAEPSTADDGSGDDGGDSTDVPAQGQDLFTANSCAGCHCADGSGGCALDAPPVAGIDLTTLTAALTGAAPHPTQPELTTDELAALAAYLQSLQ